MRQIEKTIGLLIRHCPNWQDFSYLAIVTFSVISGFALVEDYRSTEVPELSTSNQLIRQVVDL